MSKLPKPPRLPASRLPLHSAIDRAGCSWIFRIWGKDLQKHLDRVGQDIEEFAQEYKRRFGEKPDPLEVFRVNPVKVVGFFHIDSLLASIEMKIMIWRVLLGCEIVKLEFSYRDGHPPRLVVVLRPPYGEGVEKYESDSPGDFGVLRHFGTIRVNEQLVLQGYYAARTVV